MNELQLLQISRSLPRTLAFTLQEKKKKHDVAPGNIYTTTKKKKYANMMNVNAVQ